MPTQNIPMQHYDELLFNAGELLKLQLSRERKKTRFTIQSVFVHLVVQLLKRYS